MGMQTPTMADPSIKPRTKREPPLNSSNGNEFPMESGSTQTARLVKILLVDDDPASLTALQAVLDRPDQEIVTARSGREALSHLLEQDFALILLDVKMPDLDGFETAELIRQRKRSQRTPILFLTGYANDAHLFRGYGLGGVDFLIKPIIPEVLRSKVSVFVELNRLTQELEQQVHERTEEQRGTERELTLLIQACETLLNAPKTTDALEAILSVAQ